VLQRVWKSLLFPERCSSAPDSRSYNGFRIPVGEAALLAGARRIGGQVVGGRQPGVRGKSLGAIVALRDGSQGWLKVSGLTSPLGQPQRDAELDARKLVGVCRPDIIRISDWKTGRVKWRALLMTLAPSLAVEPSSWRSANSCALPRVWFEQLRSSLYAVRRSDRSQLVHTPEVLRNFIVKYFGERAPTHAEDWRVCHCDLTWRNVTGPNLMLLDWEHWGLAPRGFDVARLLSRCGDDPATAKTLELVFAKDLNTPSGRVALLAAIAIAKSEIDAGDHDPANNVALDHMARRIIERADQVIN
jgi:hypothetical protein